MQNHRVIETKLDNGLTLLVCPKQDASIVSIQLWYKVGSKHEKTGQRGIAHFIEHMIFKGTNHLTESDINLVTNKLSGMCNAFTWYDYTGYLFDIPVANWDKVLPIMADCMRNCTFKQEHLNSEVKAVIQELKMGKDNYVRHLREDLISNIFESHPYHYSTIGFKEDLWSVNRQTLLEFYTQYYTPDNAAMVIVGDVDPAVVHAQIEQIFGTIPSGNGWNNQEFYINEDIKTKNITLYRDIQQSTCVIAFVMPGIVNKNEFELECLTYILANGRGSRLYKLLVDNLSLVVSISACVYDMFDRAIFFIEFNPKQSEDISMIVDQIQQEIDNLALHGPTLEEVERAERFAQIEHQQMLEDTQSQAYAIGKSFIATQDANYPFTYGTMTSQLLQEKIQLLTQNYCSRVARHQGQIVAIPKNDLYRLDQLQQKSDETDFAILQSMTRESLVEEGSYVHTIDINPKKIVPHARPNQLTLLNGLEVLWLESNIVDTIECQLELKAKNYYDPTDLQGLAYITSLMMLEGTTTYPGQTFADTAESYGITFSVSPGSISMTMLSCDLEIGLTLLTDMLINAQFTQQSLDKIKTQTLVKIKKFWDNPSAFGSQLARESIYQGHPWSSMILGSTKTIDAINLQDCINFYTNFISPQGSRCALVGHCQKYDVEKIIKNTLGAWHGPVVQDLIYPELKSLTSGTINSYINRDQIVLIFAGLSVQYTHPDYDAILIFEQILTGGVLGSMSSRLFELREQSGLFYGIGGSLLYGAGKQPGMIYIKTTVSADRVDQAVTAIGKVLDEAIDYLPEEELEQAKNGLINSFDTLYESNEQKASTLLFLKKYDLPFDYFEKRVETLQKIDVKQIVPAVKKMLSTDKLILIKIGRV